MNITIKTSSDELSAERDYRDFFTVIIDGKQEFSVSDGEPEDSNLGRDFNDVMKIPDLMKMAYEAGVRGEEFIVSEVKVQPGEDW